MDVADVQQPEGPESRGQDGQGFFPQDELVFFPKPVAGGRQSGKRSGCGSDGAAPYDAPNAAREAAHILSHRRLAVAVAAVVTAAVSVAVAAVVRFDLGGGRRCWCC